MWEALAAIGSILSAIVIAATVIFAARQVRVTVDQLEQVRKATQFEAARTVLLDLAEPSFVECYRFVATELEKMMEIPAFRRELGFVGLADETVHKEIGILRALDRIGTYVRFGLVDGDVVYSTYGPRIVLSYERLTEVMAIHRQIAGSALYRNIDYLYDDCRRWLAANGVQLDTASISARIATYQSQFPTPAAAAGND